MVTLTALPINARPRELLFAYGVDRLSLEELVAAIVGSGSKGRQVHQLATQIVQHLLTGHFTPASLAAIPGVGKARAAAVIAAYQLGQRLQRAQQEQVSLNNPDQLYQACADLLDTAQEQFVAVSLSSRQTILQRRVITVGTASASLVHPREVFRFAIESNALALAVMHNHPSGNPTPSQADLTVTKQLATAGKVVGIELIDHLICTTTGYTSLKMANPELF